MCQIRSNFRIGEEENAKRGAIVLETLESKLGLVNSRDWCVPNLNKPGSFDAGVPS
jgi:hypothetical protein